MIQCPICQKEVRGPSQMRIHMTSHNQSTSPSISDQPRANTINSTPSQIQTAPSQSSALDQMKQQIANQNEILMLMSTNKMLRDQMTEKPHQTTVQQPSTVNDFLSQFNQMREFEENTRQRILSELPEEDEDEDEIDMMGKELFKGILNGNQKHGQTEFGVPQTPTAEAQVDQALSE